MTTLRLFIAANLDEVLRERLGGLISDLRTDKDGVRWVRHKGIHLTLKFFGSVDSRDIPKISEAATESINKITETSKSDSGKGGRGAQRGDLDEGGGGGLSGGGDG